MVGDRIEPYFLSDLEIEEYLLLYNNNIQRTAAASAQAILFYLAANPSVYRERTGEIEVYTTDAYKSYLSALELRIRYPHLFMGVLKPYAAGITKSDIAVYKNDLDNNLAADNLPSNSNDDRNFIKQNEWPVYNGYIFRD